ncbi:MAG: serine hydrolase [Patescibacteria group bacterium]
MVKKIYILIALLVLSFLANILFFFNYKSGSKITELDKKNTEWLASHSLLSKKIELVPIDSNIETDKILLHFVDLKSQLEKNLSILSPSQKLGIYIQDINTGSWMGINEKDNFFPASLLKIPIAMSVMKKIENKQLNLDDKLPVKAEDIDKSAGVPERFTVNESYTVSELLKLMLKVSDNTAKNILKRQLQPEELNAVFTHVGINNPYISENSNQYVTPREYSRLFKSLYYSTFLTPDNSEYLLSLTTDTRAESLLSAKIPWEVQIAHKYGERLDALHDCGVVYHAVNPYFICVMTSNIELAKAKDLISLISKDTYNFVNNKSQSN